MSDIITLVNDILDIIKEHDVYVIFDDHDMESLEVDITMLLDKYEVKRHG